MVLSSLTTNRLKPNQTEWWLESKRDVLDKSPDISHVLRLFLTGFDITRFWLKLVQSKSDDDSSRKECELIQGNKRWLSKFAFRSEFILFLLFFYPFYIHFLLTSFRILVYFPDFISFYFYLVHFAPAWFFAIPNIFHYRRLIQ